MFLPVNLNVQGRICLVVGGGAVALRKVARLVEFGAEVRVVSPELKQEEDWPLDKVELARRAFQADDISDDLFLVITATDDESLNETVAGVAHQRGKLVQRADAAEGSDFTFPAILRRGSVTVSFATGGIIPALSARLRRQIEPVVGPEYGSFCRMVGDLREKAITRMPTKSRREFFRALVDSDILSLLAAGNREAACRQAQEIFARYARQV